MTFSWQMKLRVMSPGLSTGSKLASQDWPFIDSPGITRFQHRSANDLRGITLRIIQSVCSHTINTLLPGSMNDRRDVK